MANEYLKPQKPLKDLNSENYFYPLTTHDLVIVTLSRLSSFMNESNNNLLNLTNIGTITSTGKFNLNGDLEIPNNHSFIGILGSNSSTDYTNVGGLTWFNLNGTAGAAANVNDTPTSAWWYIIRNRHTNTGNNYYTDLAIPFNSPSIYYKRVTGNYGSESIQGNKWVKVLDEDNYSSTLDTRYVTLGTTQTISGLKTFTNYLYAKAGHDFIHNTNEFSFIPDGYNNTLWFNYETVTRKNNGNVTAYIFGNGKHGELARISQGWFSATANAARYLENRGGSTVTINDTAWGHGHVPNGHTNRATVWHQRWTLSGLTYTPSGGSATALTDCGDIVWWLSSSNTANVLQLNIAIDGNFYTMQQMKAAGGRFGYDNYSYSLSAASFICNSWIRTVGNTGWYNETYGGGWYMIDSTYIRNYNSKQVYINARLGVDAELRLWNNTRLITRDSRGVSWIGGRDSALIRESNASGYHSLACIKTGNGTWNIGNYNTSGWTNYLLFSYTTDANYNAGTNNVINIRMRDNGVVESAMWNDYAEYRESQELKPGVCVQENDNGILTISDKRLIPGAGIISDTYGYVEGETEKAKTPIAVSGRVLAYTYQDRKNYHAGMSVCSAPNGTIDIMTREEIQKYPDAIIGIVSEIPEYKTWGTDNEVIVNNRIWIKVRY